LVRFVKFFTNFYLNCIFACCAVNVGCRESLKIRVKRLQFLVAVVCERIFPWLKAA